MLSYRKITINGGGGKGWRNTTEPDTQVTQRLELPGMDFKINTINYSKTQMTARISLDNYNLLTRESERPSQMETLELKSIIIDVKNFNTYIV